MKKRNLSLTEMLVVVGVIILLFSLGVPATIKAMKRGEMTECKGNLRQLSQAATVYLKDNNNYFPKEASNNWVSNADDPISAYLGSSWNRVNVCPSNPDEDESYRASAQDGADYVNDLNGDESETRSLKSSKVKRPQYMSLFISKDVYDASISEEWHDGSKYPFVSVSGAVTEITLSSSDLNSDNKTTRIDFKND